MSIETEIYTAKTQLKEWVKFEKLARDMMNGNIEPDDLWSKCFDEQTKLRLEIQTLEDKTVTGG